jgi:hypothetical protein
MALKPEDFIRVPIHELANPQKLGPLMVYKDRWWAIDEEGRALFYRTMTSPQCNVNRAIVEKHLGFGIEKGVVFLPWAWVPFRMGDYA